MRARSSELITRLGWVTLCAMVLGVLAGVGQALAQGVDSAEGTLRGLLIGLLAGVSIGSIELIFDRGPLMWKIRRLPGFVAQVLRFGFFFVSLVVSIVAGLWAASQLAQNPINGELWPRLIGSSSMLALALALMLLPIFKVMQLLTLPTLIKAMLGSYFHPRHEERAILFMDLKDSTQLIERVGDQEFLRFLNDILFRITGTILESRGEIYRYVGDEFIITWPKSSVDGSIECVMAIQERLANSQSHFERRFGCTPSFRYGLHFGSVLVGELGDLRSEIAFIGDAINTTKRIEDISRHFSFDVMASEAYLEHLTLPSNVRATPVEAIRLRGKTEPMQLYGLKSRPK